MTCEKPYSLRYLVEDVSRNSKYRMQDKCKGNDTAWEDKYISFALRNKRINHKSIIHRSGNSNQSRGVADDEYVTRNCSHRYSAGNVSMRAEMHSLSKTCARYVSVFFFLLENCKRIGSIIDFESCLSFKMIDNSLCTSQISFSSRL